MDKRLISKLKKMYVLNRNTYGKKYISENKHLGTDLSNDVLPYEIILLRIRIYHST